MSKSGVDVLWRELYSNDKKVKPKIVIGHNISSIIIILLTARINKKWTQKDLSKKSGIKERKIAKIERVKIIPKIDTILTLAYWLEVDLIIKEK